MNVLVVEDDRKIVNILVRGLSENGHLVSVANDGREGTEMILTGGYDAALLDVLLPGVNGLSVLETVRSKRCKTAIMMLTAVDAVPDILKAFDLGADDYLVKPFLLEILLARLGAISRRRQTKDSPVLQVGDISLDRSRRTVERGGRPIHLTRKQFSLLEVLMSRNGLITTREDLIEAGWGYLAEVKDNTLDVYVHGLRAKLNSKSKEDQTLIRTVHGTGYIFQAS